MNLAIGIDAGGTYTDAVLIDYETGAILATAKALTTKHDLIIGIREALQTVLAHADQEIQLVSLSTTLATNAIVEGRGAPVCALLIGYEQAVRPGAAVGSLLGGERYALIAGGHTMDGEERAPLDMEAARREILAHAPYVGAFAISGYFATRNPAHELAVQGLVRELTDLPSTCGHELTQQLDAVRRATTVVLNASLIPLLQELVRAMQGAMAEAGITAPLMLVKGDGSLIEAGVAARKPIETILSGPAASIVGACHLAGSGSIVAADMGGTTTDIALVEDGQPVLNTHGAQVGAWRTMIEAIDVHTVGLGGDSHVRLAGGAWAIGPQRALPLCLLAQRYPQVSAALADLAQRPTAEAEDVEFLVLQRDLALSDGEHPPFEAELYAALRRGPLAMAAVRELMRYPRLYERYLARLERQGIVIRAAFTPTDAAHVLGHYVVWSRAAAQHAATVMARAVALSPEALCREIVAQTSARIAQEIMHKLWLQDGNGSAEALSPGALARLVNADDGQDGRRLSFRPQVTPLLVGLGAPAATYFPRVAELLGARLDVPPYSSVANALGAVVGSVVARVQALVLPQENEVGYRVHLPAGSRTFAELPDALAYGRAQAEHLARSMAQDAGAWTARVDLQEQHSHAPVSDSYGGQVYVQSRIHAQAVGRPRLGSDGRAEGPVR